MSITKSVKTPRGYEVSGFDVFQELNADTHRVPLGDSGRSAAWLPVKLEDKACDEWYTLLAGRIVSIDRTLTNRDEYGNAFASNLYSGGYAPRIVPANSSGATQPITYTSDDVDYTVDVDDQDDLVSAAGAASAAFPANAPCGWLQGHVYSESSRSRLRNFDKQLAATLIQDAYVELALFGLSGQSSLAPGELVKAYAGTGPGDMYQGCPTYFNPVSDSVEQVAGRVITMSEIPYGSSARARLDLVRGMKGLSLPGLDTTGKPSWLSLAQATHYVRINITLM